MCDPSFPQNRAVPLYPLFFSPCLTTAAFLLLFPLFPFPLELTARHGAIILQQNPPRLCPPWRDWQRRKNWPSHDSEQKQRSNRCHSHHYYLEIQSSTFFQKNLPELQVTILTACPFSHKRFLADFDHMSCAKILNFQILCLLFFLLTLSLLCALSNKYLLYLPENYVAEIPGLRFLNPTF